MEKETKKQDIARIIEMLSPLEQRVVPLLHLSVEEIMQKSGLDLTSALRALRFLENKGIIVLKQHTKRIINLGTNGIYYKKNVLPERALLMALEKQNYMELEEAKKAAKLSDNEFKVSLGVLKSKALVNLSNGKLSLNATKEELVKKSLEEQLIDTLPIEEEKLESHQMFALDNLKKRKDIVVIEEITLSSFDITPLGKQMSGKSIKSDLLEEITPEVIKNWTRGKKLRRYDINAPVPKLYGGKRHFVNQATDYARRIWMDLGFEEMEGPYIETSFWVFDSLFTPQDHPAREMQDTFYIQDMEGKLPEAKLTQDVKKSHEEGVGGSKGWKYTWSEKEAKKLLLRTHTTAISSRKLASLKKEQLPAKFFALGKCFRNETLDWSHGFEFNQTEGIVIDKDANFSNLLGYLHEFFTKMGAKQIRFIPCYYPYTEPSVEISVWHPEKKVWLEIGGAGIFRPEVVIALFGEYVPVLAWGPGFDRVLLDYYQIKDFRELYSNDIRSLREKKAWIK